MGKHKHRKHNDKKSLINEQTRSKSIDNEKERIEKVDDLDEIGIDGLKSEVLLTDNKSEDNQGSEEKNEYKGKVCEAKTLVECGNVSVKPLGKDGFLVAKIPVVLAEFWVQINIESIIKLEEPALEIKRVKKNVHLTQCKLVTEASKLFISGIIRKNIEYAAVKCIGEKSISGNIKHTTVHIPFDCVTKVNFNVYPDVPNKNPRIEEELLKSDFIDKNISMEEFVDCEYFTEKVFCEIEKVKIFESDIKQDEAQVNDELAHEHTFQTIVEKMVLFLKLKLLQNQQVNIYGICSTPLDKDKSSLSNST
ncbi:CsxC family protein [Fonticella tunisiensis]|uniref:DUF7852 domain-containing protein n=1 Tax=Fonticella tunisiensis TaxID=1096341 RepID=A0A4R7KRP7_9CLOT|nr:hypothetical protein [Fonticella tunisiensis]TDT61293.1 hypothetical protein EDD71_10718 [Fonticella tunisiensis]